MRKIYLLLTVLCVFSTINAQVDLNKQKRIIEPQNSKFTKVNKMKAGLTKSAAYTQDFEGTFPGDMIILDIDGLTPNGQAGAPGKWGIVKRADDETNHAAAVTSYYDDGDKTSNDWMITPKITVPASGEIHMIWEGSSWSSSYPETYQVLISETQPDAENFDESIFTKLTEITESVGYTYNSIDLSAYYGKEVWVAFRNVSNWMWSVGIDNIEVNDYTGLDLALSSLYYQEKVALEQAQTISGYVTNMRTTKVTSFDVNWKIGEGTTNTFAVSELEIALTESYKFEHNIQYTPGATGNETVTVWISNVNDTNDDVVAENNEMTMEVEVIEGSYYQDFESSRSGVYSFDIDQAPNGNYPAAGWVFGSFDNNIMAYSTAVNGTNDWLVFPKISIDAGEFLSWKHKTYYGGEVQKYEIYVADTFDPENFDATAFTLVGKVDVDGNKLESYALPLNEYEGQSKYIAFRHVTPAPSDLVLLDDIYIFTPSTAIDAELVKIKDIQEFYGMNEEITVKGIFKNLSATTVTSYEVNYQYGDAAVVSQTFDGTTITYLQSEEFAFTQKITTDAQGIYPFKLWISKVNGEADPNTDNNELTMEIEVISDPQPKAVLIEEFTGAWCGYCPRGAVTLNELIAANEGEVVGIAHHNGDAMVNEDGSAIVSAYAAGFPTGIVNRMYWEDAGDFALSDGDWGAKVEKLLNIPTSIGIDVTNEYNESTRELTAELNVNFTSSKSGNYAMHLYLIEDSLSGEGTGWDQANYYNDDSSSPFFQQGNPIVGFQHRHVVRDVLSATWGDADIIPAENASGEYKKSYTFTVPEDYKPHHLTVVGFVTKYDEADKANRSVLNVTESHIETTPPNTGIESTDLNVAVYPNPTKGFINITNLNNASVQVYNVIGTLVKTENNLKGNATIDLSQFEEGMYIIKVTEGNKTGFNKVLLNK